VPADQIDPMLLDRSYYLEPDKSATKPYILLRDALEHADRMAVVTVSIRTRMTMAVLRVKEGVIVMQTMLWPDEIRAADFATLDEDAHATSKELDMANMLIESLAGDYDPDEYEDDYAIALEALVKAKLEGGEVRQAPERKEETGEVVDLLAALAKSVEKAKAARGEAPEAESEEPAKKSAAAKTGTSTSGTRKTASKAPAKKAAAKKAPAKKTATKKTAAKKTAKKAS
jgi:DNA end-binding protein Ku